MGIEKAPYSIVHGEDKVLELAVFEPETGEPMDLTDVTITQLTARFKNADASILQLYLDNPAEYAQPEMALSDEHHHKLLVNISDSASALLAAGEWQTFELVIDRGDDRQIVRFPRQFSVFKRID